VPKTRWTMPAASPTITVAATGSIVIVTARGGNVVVVVVVVEVVVIVEVVVVVVAVVRLVVVDGLVTAVVASLVASPAEVHAASTRAAASAPTAMRIRIMVRRISVKWRFLRDIRQFLPVQGNTLPASLVVLPAGDSHQGEPLATSHYCHGKWRTGSVASCDRHNKLSKKQTNVYRGVGEPGGRSGKPQPPKSTKSKKSSKPGSSSGSSGSGSTGSSGSSSSGG